MLHRDLALATIAFALFVLISTDAVATAPRTFVASNGDDTNPCSLALPCRAFAAAIAQTNSGGEVIVLDSAGYGPFSVAKSITISAPTGIYAGVTQTLATPAITVAATAASVVRLRGLTVTGVGPGTGDGILFSSGGMLELEKVEVSGFATTSNGGYGLKGEVSVAGNLIYTRGNNTIVGNTAGAVPLVAPLSPF